MAALVAPECDAATLRKARLPLAGSLIRPPDRLMLARRATQSSGALAAVGAQTKPRPVLVPHGATSARPGWPWMHCRPSTSSTTWPWRSTWRPPCTTCASACRSPHRGGRQRPPPPHPPTPPHQVAAAAASRFLTLPPHARHALLTACMGSGAGAELACHMPATPVQAAQCQQQVSSQQAQLKSKPPAPGSPGAPPQSPRAESPSTCWSATASRCSWWWRAARSSGVRIQAACRQHGRQSRRAWRPQGGVSRLQRAPPRCSWGSGRAAGCSWAGGGCVPWAARHRARRPARDLPGGGRTGSRLDAPKPRWRSAAPLLAAISSAPQPRALAAASTAMPLPCPSTHAPLAGRGCRGATGYGEGIVLKFGDGIAGQVALTGRLRPGCPPAAHQLPSSCPPAAHQLPTSCPPAACHRSLAPTRA